MYELGMEGHDCNISIQEVKAGGLESQGGAQLIGGQSILYETFSGKEKTKLILLWRYTEISKGAGENEMSWKIIFIIMISWMHDKLVVTMTENF